MARVKIETLTPIHIGNGQKLIKNHDFIIENGRVGFLSLEKILNIIGTENISQLTNVIETKGSIIEFLTKSRGISSINLEDLCDRIATLKSIGTNCNELKEQYFTSLRGPSIPGSSLKGAIKTVIWERLAIEKQHQWSLRDYGKEIQGRIQKYYDSSIDKKLFGPTANEKTTRFLKVGDINFNENLLTSVYEIGIYNALRNSWEFKNGQSFLAECIPPKSKANFDLMLDIDLLNKNIDSYPEKWRNLSTEFISKGQQNLCTILNSYIKKQLSYELNDLKKELFEDKQEGEEMLLKLSEIKTKAEEYLNNNSSSAIIRLGGNNGWNFTTGAWVKAAPQKVINDSNYDELRKTIQRGKIYHMDLWPKTRKMTKSGIPLGFAIISF